MKSEFMKERLDFVRARLNRYREAENAVLSSQSYSVEGMSLTRANLNYIQNMILRLEREEYKLLENMSRDKRSRIRYVIPGEGVQIW